MLPAVCALAPHLGFFPHQPDSPVDKVEDGSCEAAPDSPELVASLARAQDEAFLHTIAATIRAPAPISPPSKLDGGQILDFEALRDVLASPHGGRRSDPSRWSVPELRAACAAIADDLTSGALTPSAPTIASLLFLAGGQDKPRACIDMRPCNAAFHPATTRYPTVLDLALSGKEWLVKLDLKAAFKRVAVPKAARGLLGMVVGNTGFTYSSLPFGWTWSPTIFSATLAPLIQRIRQALPHVTIVVYVDDIAIAAHEPAVAVEAATFLMEQLRQAGWFVSIKKTFLRPVRILRFLGCRVRAGAEPSLGVTPSIWMKARSSLRAFETSMCLWSVVAVWGLVSFAAVAAPWLALFRSALDGVASATISPPGHHTCPPEAFDSTLRLAREAVTQMGRAVGEGMYPILPQHDRTVVITTDVSATGVGATLTVGTVSLEAHRPLEGWEQPLSSAARELIGLDFALTTWSRIITRARVLWRSDASAAVSAIRSWSSSSDSCRHIVLRVLRTVDESRAHIVAEWLPRSHTDIVRVDALSRVDATRDLPAQPRFRPSDIERAIHAAPTPASVHVLPTGYPAAPAYTAPLPTVPRSTARLPGSPTWLGDHETFDYSGAAALVHPSASYLAPTIARYLRDAGARPSVLMILASENAPTSQASLQRVAHLIVGSETVVERGSPILQRRVDGAWVEEPARHTWKLYTLFASPDTLCDRSLSRGERLALLFKSGFPPHPGPRASRSSMEDTWAAAAARHDPWPAALRARDLLAAAPPLTPGSALSLRSVLAACSDPDCAVAVALQRSASWITTPPPLLEQVAAAVSEIDADRADTTIARGSRAASDLLAFFDATAVGDCPFTSQALDHLATAWVRSRLRLPGAIPWPAVPPPHPPSAPAVAADCSALAARLTRRFLPSAGAAQLPQVGLGPLTSALLLTCGSSARHDASPKPPVFGWMIREGIRLNPEILALHPAAVACISLMGCSMWRSVYTRHLMGSDAAPFGDDFLVIRWTRKHKTSRTAGRPGLPSTARLGYTAARWVVELVRPFVSSAGPSEFLFRDAVGRPLSYSYLTSVLRLLLDGVPGAPTSATLHGLRVGCDSEMRALGVSDEVRDLMGWWAQALRRMSRHYESVDVASLLAASARYGSLLARSLAPGHMTQHGTYNSAEHLPASPIDTNRLPGLVFPSAPVGGAPVSIPPNGAVAAAKAAGFAAAAAALEDDRDAAAAAAIRARLPAGAARMPHRCGGCGAFDHRQRKVDGVLRCPKSVVNVLGDDASESSGESDDQAALQLPNPSLETLPVPLRAVGSQLLRRFTCSSSPDAAGLAPFYLGDHRDRPR